MERVPWRDTWFGSAEGRSFGTRIWEASTVWEANSSVPPYWFTGI